MKHWQRLLIALLVSASLYSKQVAGLLNEKTRFFLCWDATDGWALITGMLGLGLAFFLGHLLLRKHGGLLKRIYEHAFVLIFSFGLVSNLLEARVVNVTLHWQFRHTKLLICWILLCLLLGWSLARGKVLVVKIAGWTALIFSPFVFMLVLQVLRLEPYKAVKDPLPEPSRAEGTPVFFMVFDEWSYPRTHGADGRVLETLPAIRALADRACNFSEVTTPAVMSYQSIPALLYGRQVPLIKGQYPDIAAIREREAEGTMGSLFRRAKDLDYTTGLIGSYLPYRSLFPREELDFCDSASLYPKGRKFHQRVWMRGLWNAWYWYDPLTRRTWAPVYATIDSEFSHRHNLGQVERSLEWMGRAPDRSLTVLHFMFPHAPFIYDAQGHYSGPYDFRRNRDQTTVEEYQNNLQFMDRQVQRLMDGLGAERLERALLILTSDHGWRWHDPDYREKRDYRHAPLLLKLPGQREARYIDRPVQTIQLTPFLEQVLSGGDTEQALELLYNLKPKPGRGIVVP